MTPFKLGGSLEKRRKRRLRHILGPFRSQPGCPGGVEDMRQIGLHHVTKSIGLTSPDTLDKLGIFKIHSIAV